MKNLSLRDKTRKRIYFLTLTAILTALCTVITYFVSIPLPGGKGYLNLSDSIIMVTASIINPFIGGIVGGVSGFLSDVFLGYGASYAPFTVFIKFIEGLVAGFAYLGIKKLFKGKFYQLNVLTYIVSGLLMAVMYMIPDAIFFKDLIYIDLVGNIFQGLAGAGVGFYLLFIFRDNPYFYKEKFIKENNKLISLTK